MEETKKYCTADKKSFYKVIAAMAMFEGAMIVFFLQGDEDVNIISLFMIPLVLFLFIFLFWGKPGQRYKQSVEYLTRKGLYESAVSDFAISIPTLGGAMRVGKEFLFGQGGGVIIPYSDLNLIERHEYTVTKVEPGKPCIQKQKRYPKYLC